jgi:hypothetical protein
MVKLVYAIVMDEYDGPEILWGIELDYDKAEAMRQNAEKTSGKKHRVATYIPDDPDA